MWDREISYTQIESVIDRLNESTVMVIGDIMIDEYMWGSVNRISPEAPVPVLEVHDITSRLGGAANVIQNLSSLSVKTDLIAVAGDDTNGEKLRGMLEKSGCSTDGIYFSSERPTTIKTRLMAHQQQIVRADQESSNDLTETEQENLKKIFDKKIASASGVIISDYGKGVICPQFLQYIIDTCKQRSIFVAVDPKEKHFELYKGVSVITPNLKEAFNGVGEPYRSDLSDDEIKTLGNKLMNTLELSYLLLTLSERGMALFDKDKSTVHVLPTEAQKVYDVTGAGDTVISVFTAAAVSGATPLEAAYIANHAAGIVVAEIGTASVTKSQLKDACVKKN